MSHANEHLIEVILFEINIPNSFFVIIQTVAVVDAI